MRAKEMNWVLVHRRSIATCPIRLVVLREANGKCLAFSEAQNSCTKHRVWGSCPMAGVTRLGGPTKEPVAHDWHPMAQGTSFGVCGASR